MVTRLGATRLGIDTHKQRKLDNPHIAVRPLMNRWPTNLITQRTEHLARGHPIVGNDQYQVTSLGTHRGAQCSRFIGGKELGYWRIEPAPLAAFTDIDNLHPHEALRSGRLGSIGELVEPVTTELRRPTGDTDALNRFGTSERLEPCRGKHRGQPNQFHTETKIRLIDPEPFHRLTPGHPLDLWRPLPRRRLSRG